MIWVAFACLGGAAACFFYRLLRGPTVADRIVAVDGMLVVGACAIATEAARSGITVYFPVLVVLALVGFVSTAVASKIVGEPTSEPEADDTTSPTERGRP